MIIYRSNSLFLIHTHQIMQFSKRPQNQISFTLFLPSFLAGIFLIFLFSKTKSLSLPGFKNLFNGKDLSGWYTYLGPELDASGKRIPNSSLGKNKDPRKVFSIVELDGEKVIRISGESNGALTTLKDFENFHLQLWFKWGKLQFGSKRNSKKDSGILYYSVGDEGADNGNWMRSQEFQIEEGNCGEYWGCAGGSEEIRARMLPDSTFTYDPHGTLLVFNEKSRQGRHCKKFIDSENPTGEWNKIDLYSFHGTSVHMVNGKVVMVLQHSSQLNSGNLTPLVKGKIQIQSEGCEVYYKKIQIESISGLPKSFLHSSRN